MVDDTAEAIFAAEDDHIDLSTLVRLGAWGLGAAAALGIAIAAGQSDIGGKRMSTALTSVPAGRPTAASPPARASGQPDANEPDSEARQMAETVRVLAADRDRLADRIAALERNLDDVTGSIARFPPTARTHAPVVVPNAANAADLPAITPSPGMTAKAAKAPEVSAPKVASAAPPPTASPAPSPPAPAAAEAPPPRIIPLGPAAAQGSPVQTPPTQAPLPQVSAPREPVGQGAAAPAPAAPIPAAQSPAAQSPATQVVALPIAPPALSAAADRADATADNPGIDSVATKTEFALDVGGSTTMQGLRVIWASLKAKHPALVDGLRPLVAVRETPHPGALQLRLIVGPLADAGAAARLCAILASTGRLCETALFDGQRLITR